MVLNVKFAIFHIGFFDTEFNKTNINIKSA